MRKAVFLDRDGTIIDDVGYLRDPRDIRFLPGAITALRELKACGFVCVLVTNQSGVARGLFSEQELDVIHQVLQEQLSAHEAALDAIYYCPHHPDVGPVRYRMACECRKPRPGMFLQAMKDLGVAPQSSFAVGDSLRDVQAARAAGVRGLLLHTGSAEEIEGSVDCWKVVDSLPAAVRLIAKRGDDI